MTQRSAGSVLMVSPAELCDANQSPRNTTIRSDGGNGDVMVLSDSEANSENATTVITSPRRFIESLDTGNEFWQKVMFVVSVILVVVVTYAFFVDLILLIFIYTILFPSLIVVRFVIYYRKRWHYFLLDFCYFANVLLLINLWLLPHNWEFFMLTFGALQSTLLPSVAIFRNMVVLHCLDRMTSVFIHIVPSLILFAVRWKPKGIYDDMVVENLSSTVMSRSVWICGVGTLFALAHQLLYIIFVELLGRLFPDCITVQKNQNYLTSVRYLVSKSKILQRFLKRYPIIVRHLIMHIAFVVGNFLFSIPAVACYEYKLMGSIYLIVFGLCAIWNGATFYIDVFRNVHKQASKNVIGSTCVRVKEVPGKSMP
eukprot:GEMP01052134.1.p1 GENE.GEMP01052134.1~~GEMP01052134.1.p1  ORF type:complete len:369 (+),score=25.63 GEMP01052134.1:170-1276(+)